MFVEKHGEKSRRSWGKLHLAVDADTGQIVTFILTQQDVDDPSQVSPPLDQIEKEIVQVTADGAYDGGATYGSIAQGLRLPPCNIAVNYASSCSITFRISSNFIQRDSTLVRRRRSWSSLTLALCTS